MNLADAIRQAALRQSEDHPNEESASPAQPAAKQDAASANPASMAAEAPSFEPNRTFDEEPPAASASHYETEGTDMDPNANDPQATPEAWGNDTGKLTIEANANEATQFFAADSVSGEPVEMPQGFPGIVNGNAVRFEIFLSPEQLSCLFRALVSTQHSMMTLREAAHYLRIPSATLEQLASEGKIPALQFEGRWRFPKSGMDEWVMLQSFREGEVSDAA